jgi:ABC-type uncharacterized transport system auxiliary subunit
MPALRNYLVVVLCALTAACGGARPVKYYRIEAPVPVRATAAAGPVLDVSLQVGNIDSPPIMRDGRILYQVGANEVGTYEYHRWVESPDRMVQNALVRLLRSSGTYTSVETPRSGSRPDYIIQGRISEFGEVDKPQIYTRVSLEIDLRDASSGRTVWSRLYSDEELVDGKEMTDVVRSLDQNLKRGLAEIVTGLDQYFAGRAAAGASADR